MVKNDLFPPNSGFDANNVRRFLNQLDSGHRIANRDRHCRVLVEKSAQNRGLFRRGAPGRRNRQQRN